MSADIYLQRLLSCALKAPIMTVSLCMLVGAASRQLPRSVAMTIGANVCVQRNFRLILCRRHDLRLQTRVSQEVSTLSQLTLP